MGLKSLKDHPIRASLNRMAELLKDPAFHAPQLSLDEEASFNRDKLQAITKSLASLVVQSAPSLVSESALNAMNSNLQQPINELVAFQSNRSAGHLANAVAYVDQNVLNYTWAFGPNASNQSKAEIASTFEELREQTRQTIKLLQEQKNQLDEKLGGVAESIRGQESRINELNELHAKIRAESAAAVADLGAQFNTIQGEQTSRFNVLLEDVKTRLTSSEDAFSTRATSILESLAKHNADAARIVQVVGDIGVTGNYQSIANKEARQANLWRWITVGLFGAGLLMAGLTFWRFMHEPVTVANTAAIAVRLLYALAVAAPALYTARESARHRTNSDRARQTELELASLGPFIELMEESDKDEIRKSLICKYFGRSVDAHEVRALLDGEMLKAMAPQSRD
ncbi:MAG: hypothetical protein ACOH1V_07900 [Stenotrophomonas sp.]